jgi:hypothetical protein
MRKEYPFPFFIEELSSLRPHITQAFGFTYVYLEDKLLCGLRNSAKRCNSNGIWLFTTTEDVESLGNEFNDLPRRCLWRSKQNAWVILSSRLENFEEYAFKASELMLNGDTRIGRISRRRESIRPLAHRTY